VTVATQVAERLEIPDVSFGAIAPEILLTGVALLLLGLAVGGGARVFIGGFGALVSAGIGVWFLLTGLLVPGAALVAVGAGTLAFALAFDERPELMQIWLAAIGLVGALALTVWQWTDLYAEEGARTVFSGAIAIDGVALYARGIIFVTALLVLPVGYGYLKERGIYRLEFEPLLLFSVIGMTILSAAGDLLIVFLAIELLSFPLYILAGIARRDRRAQEAALKYFLTGAVASAILLFGIALVYIATGSIALSAVAEGVTLVGTPFGVVLLALALITVGLGFKAAVVPFHFWTPDVYQGSPTNVTAFMAAATKAAAFVVLLRVYLLAFGQLEQSWVPVLATLAALTMLLGAIAAIVQRDVKRVLAYSSVAHVGYALVGVTSGSIVGLSATMYYLLTYAVSAVAAFACIVAIERRRRGEVALIELKGLGRRSPVLAGIFGLSLLSLAGIPATAGFTGKFAVFRAGVEADLVWLVVVGVVSSVIAAFFYLRLMAAMFLEDPEEGVVGAPILSTGLSAAIAVAAAAVVVLGILPEPFVALADQAASIAR
jgi:NADH-quinone oxidoreductase subunit N